DLPRAATIVVVDASGRLRGLAKQSFFGPAAATLRFTVPVKRGFDGYVSDVRPGERLRVLVLGRDGAVLARVDLEVPGDAR
ncbi:MAG TPA: hypothetical protein VGC30_10270, partial [Dokdonella sp.]